MKYAFLFLFWCVAALGQATFPTNAPAPLSAPAISALTCTETTVLVIWIDDGVVPSADGHNGYFIVSYGTIPGVTTGTQATANTLQMSANIPGLTPNTTYYFNVQFIIPPNKTQIVTRRSPPSAYASITTWP